MGFSIPAYVEYAMSKTDDILSSHDDVATTSSTTYVKLKTLTRIRAIAKVGSYRISFAGYESGAGAGTGRIYRNGAAIGTERTLTTTETEFTEDFSFTNLKYGDTFELWAKASSGMTATVKNFRLKGIESGYVKS